MRRFLVGVVAVVVDAASAVGGAVAVFVVVGVVAATAAVRVKVVVAAAPAFVAVVVVGVAAANRARVVSSEMFGQKVVLNVLVGAVAVSSGVVVLPFPRAVRRLVVVNRRQQVRRTFV